LTIVYPNPSLLVLASDEMLFSQMNSLICPPAFMSITSDNRRRRPGPNFRAWLDYFMALLMLFFGCVIMFPRQILGVDYFKDSMLIKGAMKWVIGGLFILYGFFRAYRGYLAAKLKDDDEE
jgi:hypothetical protein